jgi:hypothetical protein
MLTAEELLAGAEMIFDIEIPDDFIDSNAPVSNKPNMVRIRPLTFGTFQLIMKSAREDPGLIPLLMVKEGLVEPKLSMAQVNNLPIGLLEYILEKIRELSGLSKKKMA